MLTRFVLSQAWKHKGLALAGLAFYLYAKDKKKHQENMAPVNSSSQEEASEPKRPHRRRRR